MSNLKNRVLVYSVNTDVFFNNEENKIGINLMNLRIRKSELEVIKSLENGEFKKYKNKDLHNTLKSEIDILSDDKGVSKLEAIDYMVKDIEKEVSSNSKELKSLLNKNNSKRELMSSKILIEKDGKLIPKSGNVVALFESSLSRTLELSGDNVNDDLIIVKVLYEKVLEDLIKMGFTFNNEDYVYLSSSSGQLKAKKCVFVKKSSFYKMRKNKLTGKKYTNEQKLMCGLSKERINNTIFKKGDAETKGVNINKYLAYLMLQNSATSKWNGFDIDKVLVVPDLEMTISGIVDFIDRDTYKITTDVKKDDLEMNVTDGCGMILPSVSKKSFQFRFNWTKGLLCPFDFLTFAKEVARNTKIKDVWGDEHDIQEEGIEILITSSQLKMWKYYKDWNEFKQLFKDYECEAGICNAENVTKDIHLNYQFIQSLTSMQLQDLKEIAKLSNDDIENLGSSKEKLLRSLGATEENPKKNHLQQALLLHNNLLNDPHVKSMVKNKKEKMIKEAKAGSLRIEGKRMFVFPDLYGFCEFLFNGATKPKGLLSDGNVFSKNLESGECDIMRSPQLFREHGIRTSYKSEELSRWFIAGGLYVSNWDLLSRLLQFDWDGDEINACTNTHFVRVAKEHMEGVNPLFYHMESAPLEQFENENIYNSLKLAFAGNIGKISNKITKIYSSAGEFTEDKLKAIKLLTMYNNFMIDYSKTKFLPKMTPEKAMEEIKVYTNSKAPYFFQFAKDYDKNDIEGKTVKEFIEEENEDGKKSKRLVHEYIPIVNMLEDIISTKNIHFRKVADKLDYRILLTDQEFKKNTKNQPLYKEITEKYRSVNKNKKWMIDKESDGYKENKYLYVSQIIKDDFMIAARKIKPNVKEEEIADILIDFLYREKKADNKKTLWEVFGDIMLNNLMFRVNGNKTCGECGEEFSAISHKEKYCSDKCKKEANKKSKQKYKDKLKVKMTAS
ncbi:hypothetical protein [Alkalihalophilus marmarensis]|uniref:hypothetical protein n=1 Tax=Alkalihalophilus marmarensis TaxID=521377 RepID=UPI002E236C76|nr:hypothetical protein [Alkalihalophilus marmarensis]